MTRIAFLRGINVSGKNKIPMNELESLCIGLKWQSVRTHLQTGNVIFSSEGLQTQLEHDLETAIESHFGFSIPVIVRDAALFERILEQSPLSQQAESDPSHVLIYLT